MAVSDHVNFNDFMEGVKRRNPGQPEFVQAVQEVSEDIFDFIADNGYFGTAAPGRRGAMLLSSASSKTAMATAAQLARRPEVEVIGLTSPANVAFCESLGIYSRVITYDQLDQLPADTPCVYVDFAGSGPLRKAVHTRSRVFTDEDLAAIFATNQHCHVKT